MTTIKDKEPTTLAEVLGTLDSKEKRDDKYQCPACHEWRLVITKKTGKVLVKCWTPDCPTGAAWKRITEKYSGRSPTQRTDGESAKPKKLKPSELPDWKGITLDDYCQLKRLDRRLLEYLFGARQETRRGKPVVAWPYFSEDGKLLATKIRLSTDSHDTNFDPADPHVPYGLNNPHLKNMIARSYDLLITEGESDCHTFACWGYTAIGISGNEGWLPEYAELPIVENAARVMICEDQDEGGKKFVAKVQLDLPQALVLRPPQGVNDFSDLHLKHVDYEDPDGGFLAPHPFIQSVDIAIQAATLEKAMRQPKGAKPRPAPMRDEAFHGVAGRIVRLLEPVLEADRASILSNVLASTGMLFQHKAHFLVTADPHYPVDYFLTVGRSSVSRKGTTTNAVWEVLEHVQPGFKARTLCGLSTGQGLISALIKKASKEEQESPDYEPEAIADSVLIEVSEFAGLLAVMRREENPLVSVLRDAWDGRPLCVLTRNQPLRCPNVSLTQVAHVTRKELLEKLTETDKVNGFANRFLFIRSERAKLLPNGSMKHLDYSDIVHDLVAAVRAAEGAGAIERDENTERLWAEEYKRLTARSDSMIDTLLSRAEAHVVRLSLLYALLDSSNVIREEHLRAALAVWDYCEASVQYVFGDGADKDEREILRKLENDPLTNGEIHRHVFHDHKTPEWVAEKMLALEQQRKVRRVQKDFKTGPREAWALVW